MSRAAGPSTRQSSPATPGIRTIDPAAAGHVPPQDLDAEMGLLGSMLLDPDCIGLVLQIIPRTEAQRFYRPDNRILFEVLLDLHDQGKPIDIIVLEDELRRRSQMEEVGGRDYLIDLHESVPSAANAEYYARIVREKALLRDLIQCTGEITNAAYEQRENAVQILDDAEKLLFAVTEQRISRQVASIRDCLDEALKQLDTYGEGVLTGLPTGFNELDALLGGFQLGDFIVVAARPSMGKTALGLSLLEYVGIVEKIPAAFFSLEMGRQQIVQRMLCSHAQVDMHRLRHGRLSEKEITKLKLVAGNMRNYPVFLDDTPGMSVMELRAKARRLKMLHGIKIVFVDYLQLMYDRAAARENRQQEIASISRSLKALGRELEVPVVAMAQLNRQVEERTSNRPRMSDLRESGAIEQDADVVILLHREEYYWDKKKRVEKSEDFQKVQGKAELIVDKQRNGPTGVVELHFNARFARFDSAAPSYLQGEDPAAMEYSSGGIEVDASFDGGPASFDEDEPAPF